MQVRRRGEGTPPYGTVCRGGRPCPPAPDNATPCRAGPVCPAGCGKSLSGRRGRRPLQRHSPIELRRGRCPHRPASVTRGAEERAGKSAKRRQWRMQRGDFEEVPRLAAATVAGNRLARRWAREPRPYGSATRDAMGGRPQGSPLRMGCKRCSGQATMRVAHTEAGLWGHEDFFVFMQIYTGKTAWDLLYSSL